MSTVREAERDANAILVASWWSTEYQDTPVPVDPFTVARKFGIEIGLTILPDDESGNITITPAGSRISLNYRDSPNRLRFTCAHEIGHYNSRLQQGQINEDKTFVDRRAQLASAGVDVDEIYANQFAAALLMPAHLVARGYRTEQRSPEALARRFETSVQAMNLRLRNLNLA